MANPDNLREFSGERVNSKRISFGSLVMVDRTDPQVDREPRLAETVVWEPGGEGESSFEGAAVYREAGGIRRLGDPGSLEVRKIRSVEEEKLTVEQMIELELRKRPHLSAATIEGIRELAREGAVGRLVNVP